MPCGTKWSKQEYVNRDGTAPDEAILAAQALAHVDCFLKTVKIGDPNRTDDQLIDILRGACEQKARQQQSRRGKATAEEPMDDIEFEAPSSDAPTNNLTATTTPISPPPKKRRLEPTTPPLGFNVRPEAKGNTTQTPQSERASTRNTFSGPDYGPPRPSTPEGERVSLYIERDFDENLATMETTIQQTIQLDDHQATDEVRVLFGDWFNDLFDWNA